MSDCRKFCVNEAAEKCCHKDKSKIECICPENVEPDISGLLNRLTGSSNLYFDRFLLD